MKNRQHTTAALALVAFSLGLAWAVRGHFGHEWGAAWAGAVGSAAVLVATGRKDWACNLPVLVLLGAVGWGAGGMMSYGLVVGYGRGTDFLNVWYGLSMLGVVGGLYGFIGGGLFGLGLETSGDNRPNWASLLAEMVAGAWLTWGLLIYQLEWLMTPPRSELWAACLGASIALAWYLHRNGFVRALRVAGYAALGAGFGFAFGNFIQVLGTISGLSFNWWNAMEFSLGFFGGLGLAYGVITRDWSEMENKSSAAKQLALFVVLVGLPATNLIQTFDAMEFHERALGLGLADPGAYVARQFALGWGLLLLVATAGWGAWRRMREQPERLRVIYAPAFLFGLSALYIMAAHIKKGVFAGVSGQLPHYLYWLIWVVMGVLWWRRRTTERELPLHITSKETSRIWAFLVGLLFLLAALMAYTTIHLHDGLPGANERF